MSVEERHLLNKIRFFEDMLLRSKDYRQQENIGKELTVKPPYAIIIML